MIKARHKALYVKFFNFYSRWMIRWHFRKVRINGHVQNGSFPILMIGNHFSWWDGFIACYINEAVFRKKFHIMMLEEQLRPRMFLNRAGAYSIRRGSRDALETLKYTAGLLHDPGNLVVLYPQGELESIYGFPVKFEKGIEAIALKSATVYHLVFYSALLDYFSHRKPLLNIYLKEVPANVSLSVEALQSAYNDFLQECFAYQKPE